MVFIHFKGLFDFRREICLRFRNVCDFSFQLVVFFRTPKSIQAFVSDDWTREKRRRCVGGVENPKKSRRTNSVGITCIWYFRVSRATNAGESVRRRVAAARSALADAGVRAETARVDGAAASVVYERCVLVVICRFCYVRGSPAVSAGVSVCVTGPVHIAYPSAWTRLRLPYRDRTPVGKCARVSCVPLCSQTRWSAGRCSDGWPCCCSWRRCARSRRPTRSRTKTPTCPATVSTMYNCLPLLRTVSRLSEGEGGGKIRTHAVRIAF